MQKALGNFFGEFWRAYNQPTIEARQQAAVKAQLELANQKQLREQAALEFAGELEKQRKTAEAYAKNSEQFVNQNTPVPTWDETDQLFLYDAYNRANIDREAIAKANREEMVTDAFNRGVKGISNEAALVNIGMGKEYKPVELEGGVFYNPYDTQNFNLGSTQKHQAEAKLKQSEAAEQALRLEKIRQLSDPLMQINATSNKELGKPIEAEVEGPNGETHKTLITQDSSGSYHHAPVTDRAGKPLVIPPEAVGGSSGLTSDQRNVKFYADLWKVSEAEAATRLKSRSVHTDAGAWEAIWNQNKQGAYGSRKNLTSVYRDTITDYKNTRYGSPLRPGLEEEIRNSKEISEKDKEELLTTISDYNNAIAQQSVRTPVPAVQEPETVPVPVSAVKEPETVSAPVSAPPPVMAMAEPSAPAPIPDIAPTAIPEASPAPDFQAFTETVMANNSPAEINAALRKQGFDLSSQAMGAMAIDAINQGVSVQDIQQFYQLLGIQWTPPA